MAAGYALAAIAALMAVSTSYQVYSGEKNRTAQNEAQDKNEQSMLRQEEEAKKQTKLSEEAMNRQYRQSPNSESILSKATQAGKAGQSGTLLTGDYGVDPESLKLGKTTLLGG